MDKMVSPNARLCYIDRIKILGLFLVILAHVDLPVRLQNKIIDFIITITNWKWLNIFKG